MPKPSLLWLQNLNFKYGTLQGLAFYIKTCDLRLFSLTKSSSRAFRSEAVRRKRKLEIVGRDIVLQTWS